MNGKREIPRTEVLDQIADENGLAVVVLSNSGEEVSASNNNSICRGLNPDGRMTGACTAFCGTALDEVNETGSSVSYTCHAGLECSADVMLLDGKPVAVIVGRTFVRSENYRKATERAITGDWQKFPPSEFFENILLSGSPDMIEKALKAVIRSASPVVEDVGSQEKQQATDSRSDEGPASADGPQIPRPVNKMAAEIARLAEKINRKVGGRPETPAAMATAADAGAWRSFFSSILKKDHRSTCEAILEMLAQHYGFKSLAWLERRNENFVTVTGYGETKNTKLRLEIGIDDPRFADAVKNEEPIVLTERAGAAGAKIRQMHLFPVPASGDIPSALAILDPIENEATRRQIARLCHSIGPQVEILRLRDQVSRRESLSQAVRRFSDDLKHVDADDFWLRATQIATELMQAERGSLLVPGQSQGSLEIKAAVGLRTAGETVSDPGKRVARTILERGKPAVVAEVERTVLGPSPKEREYKTSSFLSAPVTIGGRNIGVISFTDKANGGRFDRSDLELLQELTPQIAVAIDRATLKAKAGEFEQLSVTDALTGLLNRRYIEERLVEEVKRSNRHGYPMSYLTMDVDHFKSYNDQFGHPAGDAALKLVAGIMKETLRGADVAARVGGEEFAILLPQTTNEEAAAIAERLRANIGEAEFPGRKVTVSIGVASCSSELCTRDVIVDASDKALYAAKHAGRNSVKIYEKIGSDKTD